MCEPIVIESPTVFMCGNHNVNFYRVTLQLFNVNVLLDVLFFFPSMEWLLTFDPFLVRPLLSLTLSLHILCPSFPFLLLPISDLYLPFFLLLFYQYSLRMMPYQNKCNAFTFVYFLCSFSINCQTLHLWVCSVLCFSVSSLLLRCALSSLSFLPVIACLSRVLLGTR